jgi:hypothetical protein
MRDTIDMAREAGCIPVRHPEYDNDVQVFATPDVLKAFEALVRADERDRAMRENAYVQAEREACEALYEHEDVQAPVGNSAWGEAYQDGWIAGAQAYRDAIRARGNT